MTDTIISGSNAVINKNDNYIHKVGYEELSSYCKGLSSIVSELSDWIECGRTDMVRACIDSMELGLSFVLEDIGDIERRLIT